MDPETDRYLLPSQDGSVNPSTNFAAGPKQGFTPRAAWLADSTLTVEIRTQKEGIEEFILAAKGSSVIPLFLRTNPGKRYSTLNIEGQVTDLIALAENANFAGKQRDRAGDFCLEIARSDFDLSNTENTEKLRDANTILLETKAENPFTAEVLRVDKIGKITSSHFFEALIACQNGLASLEIEFIIRLPAPRRRAYRVDFDPGLTGGTHQSGYQRVRIPVGFTSEEASLKLKVHFREIKDSQQKGEPAKFLISKPILRAGKGKRLAMGLPRPRLADLTKANHAPGKIVLYSGNTPPFCSPEEDSICLITEEQHMIELFAPERNSLKLISEWGHGFAARASQAGQFSLYINNLPCKFIDIDSDHTSVQLPAEWLRGEPVIAEVRDTSGSQVFLTIPMLAPKQVTAPDLIIRETQPPYPIDLTVRAKHRYQALRAHLRQPIPGITQELLHQALETLDGDYSTVNLAPLVFPQVDQPMASVIIPAHNHIEATYYTLCALLLAHNTTSFEVVLVDDGSTDKTTEIERLVSGIKIIRNEKPQRFIKACNLGVGEASGHFVVLLNNDTEVTTGWLDSLVDGFRRFPKVGAVGSKLLYPDGRLQDAGGIVWSSGNPWNYGNTQNPWDPRFSYARQVDYLSGAALMTTKAIWHEVGGLSHYLEPMYFEDTDFAFKVRAAGYNTYFIPSSVVYHFGGITSGTDTSKGFKQYQEVNRPKFKRRWAKEFAHNGQEGLKADLQKDRGIIGRILFIDYTTPQGDQSAGSYAAIREIELVQSLGYKVSFLPQNLAYMGRYTEELQRKGVEVITAPFYRSLVEFLKKRSREFDVAYITRYYVAADVIHLLREYSPNTRIVLNNADLHFLRELRAALSEDDESRMQTMREMREEELNIMRSVDLVLSYNEVEHAVISAHTDGQVKVMTCPWVADIPADVYPLAERRGLTFLGSFKHHPNKEGIAWFCREVMPQLQEQELKLSIYGSKMDAEIRELETKSIDPVGYIANLADAYQRHRVFVAPLLSGAGIKGKVINALTYGIPSVLSPIAAEGIGLRHGHDCLIAKNPEEWVEAITSLYYNDDLWLSISTNARSYAASQFSFARGKEMMKSVLEAVDLFGRIDD